MIEAKEIRKQLKEKLGYNARQVSVRVRHYSSLCFMIRDLSVNAKDLKEFAKQFESFDRDEVTQEILAGGNTFVFVKYSDEVREGLRTLYLDEVKKALGKLGPYDSCAEVGNTGFIVSKEMVVYKKTESSILERVGRCNSPEEVSYRIATY